MSVVVEQRFTTNAGHPAVVVLNSLGFRCGYVGIPHTHIAAKNYSQVSFLEVHGGLTFSGNLEFLDDSLHWLGFDAGHYGDAFEPSHQAPFLHAGVPRTLPYMVEECEKLAAQLEQVELFI